MKKIFLFLAVAALACMLALSVSAEVTVYDDAPARKNIQVSTSDIVVFDDGFSCPTAYVFKDVSTIYDARWGSPSLPNCFDFAYINGKTGKTYKFENIVSLDLPQGITSIGTYLAHKVTTLKRISIPDSVIKIASSPFEECTSLEECIFEHNENSGLTALPQYMFSQARSLKAFSMPDCVTELDGEGNHFANCSSLTAVYLSKNLTIISGKRGDRPSFDYCGKLYFVNEPFNYDSIPEKPMVYSFPANLGNFANQCVFRGCESLNDVLVFGTQITEMPNKYFLQNSPANTVVFLGDMTNVIASEWGTATIYFANKNDIDATSAGLSTRVGTSSGKAYYCNAEGNTNHIKEKTLSTEANCLYPKMNADYCFCGSIMGTPVTEGEALGHDRSAENGAIDLGIAYEDYFKKGVHRIDCARCDVVEEIELEALFVDKGYSACEYNTKLSITCGYKINNDAVKSYMVYSPDFEIGTVVAVNQSGDAFVPDLNSDKVLTGRFVASANDYVDIKVTGIPADKGEALIAIALYVKDASGTYFLENGATKDSLVGISYDSVPKA